MPKDQTCRQTYAPHIEKIIRDNEGKSVKELKKILCHSNPGHYGHHKKTWANEYMKQLGLTSKTKVAKVAKEQTTLF